MYFLLKYFKIFQLHTSGAAINIALVNRVVKGITPFTYFVNFCAMDFMTQNHLPCLLVASQTKTKDLLYAFSIQNNDLINIIKPRDARD